MWVSVPGVLLRRDKKVSCGVIEVLTINKNDFLLRSTPCGSASIAVPVDMCALHVSVWRRVSPALTSVTGPFPSQHIFCSPSARSFQQQVCHRKTTEAVPLIRELRRFSVLQYCLLTHPINRFTVFLYLPVCTDVQLCSEFVWYLKCLLLLLFKQSKPSGQIGSQLRPLMDHLVTPLWVFWLILSTAPQF